MSPQRGEREHGQEHHIPQHVQDVFLGLGLLLFIVELLVGVPEPFAGGFLWDCGECDAIGAVLRHQGAVRCFVVRVFRTTSVTFILNPGRLAAEAIMQGTSA